MKLNIKFLFLSLNIIVNINACDYVEQEFIKSSDLLFEAIKQDDVELADIAIKQVYDINFPSKSKNSLYYGQTPIKWARKCNAVKVAKILFKAGAIIGPELERWILKNKIINIQDFLFSDQYTQSKSRYKIVKFNLSQEQSTVQDHTNKLFDAINRQDFYNIQLAINRKAKFYKTVNVDQQIETTALYEAAETGLISIVKLLIANKADVNLIDIHGRNALNSAIKNSNLELVRLLLNCWLDIDVINKIVNTMGVQLLNNPDINTLISQEPIRRKIYLDNMFDQLKSKVSEKLVLLIMIYIFGSDQLNFVENLSQNCYIPIAGETEERV